MTSIGSTCVALLAGIHAATSVTPTRTAAVPPSVIGSIGDTPNNSDVM
jgi:hypothetical protein